MSEKIVSKVFQYGDEKEAEWPSQYGTGEKGVFHIDKETGQATRGYPKSTNLRFGEAPHVIFDSMPKTYHEAAGVMCESRQEWERLDKETNSLTFGSGDEPRRHIEKGVSAEARALKADRRKAAREATRAYMENTKEVQQKIQKRGEEQIETLKKAGLTDELKKAGVRYE